MPKPQPAGSGYPFELPVWMVNPDGTATTRFADLVRNGHFLLEAKDAESGRSTDLLLRRAFGQATQYAGFLAGGPPSYLLVLDVGATLLVWDRWNRKVVEQEVETGANVCWAVPDLPWLDETDGAAVRVAMTVVARDFAEATLVKMHRSSSPSKRISRPTTCVASADAYHPGVLSSRIHVARALAAGGRLGNDPRYNKGVCFDRRLWRFPFAWRTSLHSCTLPAHLSQGRQTVALTRQVRVHRRRQSHQPIA